MQRRAELRRIEHERDERRLDARIAQQMNEACIVEREIVGTARERLENRAADFHMTHAVGVIAAQHEQELQVVARHCEERHARDHEQRNVPAACIEQWRDRAITRVGIVRIRFGMRQHELVERLADERIVRIEFEGFAHACNGRMRDSVAGPCKETRGFELTRLRRSFQKTRGALQWTVVFVVERERAKPRE